MDSGCCLAFLGSNDFLGISMPHYGDDNNAYTTGGRFQELLFVKCLEHCLAHSTSLTMSAEIKSS